MKKNGFTLIELMGAIVILLLIVLIVFPNIISVIKKTDNKIDEVTSALIINGAKEYVEANKNNYSEVSKNYCVTIQTLIDNNFLFEDLEDAASGEKIDVTRGIQIKVSKKTIDEVERMVYEYKILDRKCS